MIRAVIIGFSHMHVNEIAMYISEQPSFELIGAAAVESETQAVSPLRYTPEWNKENIRNNYCQNIYDDYKKMCDELKPDIAFILTENVQKPEVVEECAKRGVNVCIEKPVAMNLREAKKIKASIDKYGIEAVVNWPVVWRGYIHKMKKTIDSGIVGKPLKLRYINGHTGPLGKGAKHRGVTENADEMTDNERAKTWWHHKKFGGGVLLDICCYGCLFTKWFMGDGEKSVLAYGTNLNTPYGDTEDNFAAVVKYEKKMSVIEGTWTTPRVVIPSGPMVMCTDGVIMCTGSAEGKPDVKAFDLYGNEVPVPEFSIDDSFKNMPWHYAHHIEKGTDICDMLTLDTNMEIMRILDAVVKSSASGKEEQICGTDY